MPRLSGRCALDRLWGQLATRRHPERLHVGLHVGHRFGGGGVTRLPRFDTV